MRIMTGAPMPDGADAVVPVEESDGGVQRVTLMLAAESGGTCAVVVRTSEPETWCCEPASG